jgi:hypothetical protein
MPGLTPSQLAGRLGLDKRAMDAIKGPALSYQAYTSSRKKTLITEESQAGRAAFYVVDFHARTLIGEGRYTEHCTIIFDLLTDNYPWTPPAIYQVSRPILFTPHISQNNGFVCIGPVWTDARGQLLLAQLVLHVLASIINWDRPSVRHAGYCPEADLYWREVLGGRPITPNFPYPSIPLEITHGISSRQRISITSSTPVQPRCQIITESSRRPRCEVITGTSAERW